MVLQKEKLPMSLTIIAAIAKATFFKHKISLFPHMRDFLCTFLLDKLDQRQNNIKKKKKKAICT